MFRFMFLCAAFLFSSPVVGAAGATNVTVDVTELYLLPHTHADVGWLQTVDSLARVNVSRILNGVVGNLMNDTQKRRRFVWDEMAFLQLWWEETATPAQQAAFTSLVQDGRIEFVDNGWSQHDMGCTTLDSMVSNWVEGHQWLLQKFGPAAQPKTGWSLDPFGISTTQAVLQSLMGMDSWMFTRLTDTIIDQMKKDKGLEFVWRASSALPAHQSEIFAHVFESYYCMPLPTYAFEWGANKGAVVPDKSNIISLAKGLAKIAKQRQAWFATKNVLIPWGCDYQFQNAELVYRSTDWIIDTINAHPEWGVHVQYTTPREYLAKVKASAVATDTKFPVKTNGSHFFPFGDWSGYFTSRPSLKGDSAKAVAQLTAAEGIFALHGPKLDAATQTTLWNHLEVARRNNGIVQHHDAITGTGCDNQEGCAGTDQVVGPHNVIGDYHTMLADSLAGTAQVAATILGALATSAASASTRGSLANTRPDAAPSAAAAPSVTATGTTKKNGTASAGAGADAPPLPFSLDAGDMGKILMGYGDGGDDAMLVVYNPMATVRTEIVSIAVPVCAVDVTDADSGAPVVSQVTANFGIGDGQAPYYDFELHFEGSNLPALGFKRYRISPKADDACGGGDVEAGANFNTFVRHEQRHPVAASNILFNGTVGGPDVVKEAIRRQGDVCGDPDRWGRIVKEVQADVLREQQAKHDAATMAATAAAVEKQMVVMENSFLKVYVDLKRGVQSVLNKATGVNSTLTHELYRYETENDGMVAYNFQPVGPATAVLSNVTDGKRVEIDAQASTVALGPVMHEVRIMISDQHKTRIRLWLSDDPEVGGRVEFANRIGVLEQHTEIISRFGIGTHSSVGNVENMTFYSEDNGYETIPHPRDGDVNVHGSIATHYFPSQQSCFMANSSTMLSVALDRSHAVGSLIEGTLDVVQHRRGGPWDGNTGSNGPGVLDDVERIFTQLWVAVGNVTYANRARVSMKQRLNHPLILAAGRVPKASVAAIAPLSGAAKVAAAGVVPLPSSLHLQSLRATAATADGMLLRLQHMFTVGEDTQKSVPQSVDVGKMLSAVRLVSSVAEVTLDGMQNVSSLAKRIRYPAANPEGEGGPVDAAPLSSAGGAGGGPTIVKPFELRTFKLL